MSATNFDDLQQLEAFAGSKDEYVSMVCDSLLLEGVAPDLLNEKRGRKYSIALQCDAVVEMLDDGWTIKEVALLIGVPTSHIEKILLVRGLSPILHGANICDKIANAQLVRIAKMPKEYQAKCEALFLEHGKVTSEMVDAIRKEEVAQAASSTLPTSLFEMPSPEEEAAMALKAWKQRYSEIGEARLNQMLQSELGIRLMDAIPSLQYGGPYCPRCDSIVCICDAKLVAA